MAEVKPFEIEQLIGALQQSLQNAVLKPQKCDENAVPVSYQVSGMDITLPLYLKAFDGERVFFETVDVMEKVQRGQQKDIESLEFSTLKFNLKPTLTEFISEDREEKAGEELAQNADIQITTDQAEEATEDPSQNAAEDSEAPAGS